jgi:glyoxylase-like metal-dependent hydrolase (beta-lactamase superfamily II)
MSAAPFATLNLVNPFHETSPDPSVTPTTLPSSTTSSPQLEASSLLQVHVLPVGPLQCNCVIIGSPSLKEAIIVDPGGDAELIIRWVKERLGYQTVKKVYHTHAHFDHFLASAEIKKAFSSGGDGDGGELCLHKDDEVLWDNLDKQVR